MPGRNAILGWMLILVGATGLLLIARADPDPWPAWSSLVVESALDDSVLVDVRSRSRSGAVDGPIARKLAPGSELDFGLRAGQAHCLRVIDSRIGRVTPLYLPASDGETSTRIRIDASMSERPLPTEVRCDPELEGHRVRTALGRYFEPREPHRIRRERILFR